MRFRQLSLRAKMVLMISLLMVLIVLISLVLAAWSLRQDGNTRRAEIEPRTARLLGLQQQQAKLEEAKIQSGDQLTGLVYPSKDDATLTGTKMQQDARKIIEKAGMSVAGSKVRTVEVADGYDRIGLDLTLRGNMGALEKTLLEIPKMRPLVIIEETNIKPKKGRNVPHTMSVQLRLTAMRLQP